MKLGLIVNPIAGMGGKVGLKGTDDVLQEALTRGAEAIAPERTVDFLQKLKSWKGNVAIEIVTCPGVMGEDEAKIAGLSVEVLPMKIGNPTTAADTKSAVRLMSEAAIDLIVFVGGDGTARDIMNATLADYRTPVLGVPSGVKMYSGVFAVNSSDAVEVILAFAEDRAEIAESEVMDADENAIRNDVFVVKLYGLMKVPFVPGYLQGSKEASPDVEDERDNQDAIAKFIVERMQSDATYVLGPGTTVESLAKRLAIKKTVLGVDIYQNGRVLLDVDEKRILDTVKDWENAWIVLSPIGRQGILLGRGNQQISASIIKRVGKEKIIVIATNRKLRDIESGVLRVDTGDPVVDQMLRGYIRVCTDYREWRLIEVK